MMEGPCADSVEKHEPASDDATVVVDSLKALDPNRPIREADSCTAAKRSIRSLRRRDKAVLAERRGLGLWQFSD